MHKFNIVQYKEYMEEKLDTNSFSKGVMCLIDGDNFTGMLPFDQCEIITDNFKKTFKKVIDYLYKNF